MQKLRKKKHGFQRNHKSPIPPASKDPRYSGACRLRPGTCPHCMGAPVER